MGEMTDHVNNYDSNFYVDGEVPMGENAEYYQEDQFEAETYEPGHEPGAGTYTVKSKSKPNPDFYHEPFSEKFKTIEIEHETEKAFLFYTENGSFWCPKKMVRIKDIKDIYSWKIWKGFDYKFTEAKK